MSGYRDSNAGPPAPKAGALTGLRYTPNFKNVLQGAFCILLALIVLTYAKYAAGIRASANPKIPLVIQLLQFLLLVGAILRPQS